MAITNFRTFLKAAQKREILSELIKTNSIRDGFITNMTNPKVLLFMLAFVPQFTDPIRGTISVQLLLLILIMKTNGLVVNGLVAITAGSMREWLSRGSEKTRWQSLLIALMFVSIAGWFIYDIWVTYLF